MSGILPVKTRRTTASNKILEKSVLSRARKQTMTPSCDFAGESACSIHDMLMRQGFGRTLEYYCTLSVFSVLSED